MHVRARNAQGAVTGARYKFAAFPRDRPNLTLDIFRIQIDIVDSGDFSSLEAANRASSHYVLQNFVERSRTRVCRYKLAGTVCNRLRLTELDWIDKPCLKTSNLVKKCISRSLADLIGVIAYGFKSLCERS